MLKQLALLGMVVFIGTVGPIAHAEESTDSLKPILTCKEAQDGEFDYYKLVIRKPLIESTQASLVASISNVSGLNIQSLDEFKISGKSTKYSSQFKDIESLGKIINVKIIWKMVDGKKVGDALIMVNSKSGRATYRMTCEESSLTESTSDSTLPEQVKIN